MKKQVIFFTILLIACSQQTTIQTPSDESADINAALKGIPLKCITENQGQTSTLYIKGSQLRMDTVPANAHGIYTENEIYTWSGKNGNVIHLNKLKTAKQYPLKKEEIIINAQRQGVKCTQQQIENELFIPPKDLTFNDVTEQLETMSATLK